jgi:hypothetical protein
MKCVRATSAKISILYMVIKELKVEKETGKGRIRYFWH